jgi:hypothetical protein
MGAAGREWVQREMAIDQIIEAYNAMYQRCEGSMAGGA